MKNPVLFAMSLLAGLQVIAGAVAFSDVVGPKIAGLAMVVVAAGQLSIQFWVRGQTRSVASLAEESATLDPPSR